MPSQIPSRNVQDTLWTTDDLCPRCKSVDLHNIHSRKMAVLQFRPDSSCPLCLFLYSAWTNEPPATGTVEILLRAHHEATGSLGGSFWTLGATGLDRVILPLCQTKVHLVDTPQVRAIDETLINWNTIKQWLSCCQSDHEGKCSPRIIPGKSLLTLRVIDCRTRAIVPAPVSCEFVALSYVWGKHTTTPQTIERSSMTLPTTTPQTIEDAIIATLRCGYHYLWVDQYCIDQNDPADKQVQINQMDLVYSNAIFTIIAAAGEDSAFGLPGISRPRSKQPRINLNGQVWLSTLARWDMFVSESKWSTRAWTYQEAICPSRRLFFTEDQVVFECNVIGCQETLHLDWEKHRDSIFNLTLFKEQRPSLPDEPSHIESLRHTQYKALFRFLQMYSEREMTYQSDALNAMKGIHELFKSGWQIYEHWGMPLVPDKDFANGLIWDTTISRWSTRTKRRVGFPSWSWCGWISPVTWYSSSRAEADDTRTLSLTPQYRVQELRDGQTSGDEAPVLDCSTCSSNNPCATMTLRITAETVSVRFRDRGPLVAGPYKIIVDLPEELHFYHEHHWTLKLTPDLEESPHFQKILLEETFDIILIHRFHGLVVWTLDSVTERIGLIDLYAERQKSLEKHGRFLNDILPKRLKTVLLS